jgi:hypothetical protein
MYLLESVQLEAARIITGLRKGTSHAKLCTELGWVPLKERRRTNKLILLHTILHDETPLYLLNEILLQTNHQSSYNLRFNRVFEPPFCNTTSYKCSFSPNVIDSWNLLDVDTQNQYSRLMFKKQIRSNISVLPPYFALGTRKYNIFLCQLRNLASNLNQYKFLSDGSECPCGDDVEDNFHYFYVCPLFICQRILLFTQLRDLADFLNSDVLLKRSPDLSFDEMYLLWTLSTPLFVEPKDLTINISIFQFDFVLFALNLF